MMTRRSIDERAKRLGVGWAFFFFFLFFDAIFFSFLHHHVSMTYQTLRAFLFLTTKTQRKHARTHTHTNKINNRRCRASSSNSHSQLPSILGNVLRIYKNGMCVNWLDDGMGAELGAGEHGGWLRYLGKELGLD